MAGISPLKIFMIFGTVSAWATKALEDGKITLVEAAELVQELGPLLGVPVHIEANDFATFNPKPPEQQQDDSPPLEEAEERSPPESAHDRFAPSLHT